MKEQIRILPCPFCEGPPCVTVRDYMTRELVDIGQPYDEAGEEDYSAEVWCHECGAQGPAIDSCSLGIFEKRYDLSAGDVARIAVERWNIRAGHHRELYDAGEEEGLNLFPREVTA